MTIWIIAGVYQGVFTGVELATTNEEKAQEKYKELVRLTLGMLLEDWKYVEEEYELALGCGSKVDEYYLEEVFVERD